MENDLIHKEQLSALVDGELAHEELASALAFAVSDAGRQNWQLYQMVGDVLRSGELACHSQLDVLAQVRAELAKPAALSEPPALLQLVQPAAVSAANSAANSAVFRWQLLAGLASVAAISALTWGLVLGSVDQPGVQLAQSPVHALQSVATANGSQVILRDPQLDELLASQRQYSSAAAWQMPAHFLRNAHFSASSP